MKAYLIIYGYDEDYEIDSVFLDKEKAEAYAAANNQIPFDESNKFRIREVELNPPTYNKSIVEVHGYIDKNKKDSRPSTTHRLRPSGVEAGACSSELQR